MPMEVREGHKQAEKYEALYQEKMARAREVQIGVDIVLSPLDAIRLPNGALIVFQYVNQGHPCSPDDPCASFDGYKIKSHHLRGERGDPFTQRITRNILDRFTAG